MPQVAVLQAAEAAHHREGQRKVQQRGGAEGLHRQQVVGIDIARHAGHVHQRHGAGDGRGMHQADHLVAVLGQGAAQCAGQQDAGIQAPALQAVGAGGLHLTGGCGLQRAGNDLGGVGGGVDGKRQPGAEPGLAQQRPQGAVAHGGKLRQAVVHDEHLHQQRRAADGIGEQPHRPGQPAAARHPGDGQRHRQQQAGGQAQRQQLQRHPQPAAKVGQALRDHAPVQHQKRTWRTPAL